MKELILDMIAQAVSKASANIKIILLAAIISTTSGYIAFYASIQNFNEIQKQWEKYINNPGDMKYSSLYWQYPICKENLLYKIGVEFLSPHDQIIQKKSCIVIVHCYETSIGKGATDKVDCSEENDAIKIAIASM